MDSKEPQDDAYPTPPPEWTRCRAYLPRKRRFCRQDPMPNDSWCYCGNHQHLKDPQQQGQQGQISPSQSQNQKPKRQNEKGDDEGEPKASSRRVPCPIDPSHWIRQDYVDRHVLICPKVTQQAKLSQQIFYCQNCNAGGYGREEQDKTKSNCLEEPLSLAQAQTLALAILATHESLFSSGTPSNQKDATDPRSMTLMDIENALELQDFSLEEEGHLQDILKQDHQIRFGSKKHIRQQASLLGHFLNHCHSDPKHDTCEKNLTDNVVVEVGAGRGMMGLVAASTLAARNDTVSTPTTDQQTMKEDSASTMKLLLIERNGSRGKADKILRTYSKSGNVLSTKFRPDRVQFERIACDLQHLQFQVALDKMYQNVEELPQKLVHVIGKHVCGVGTDLCLKAILPLCRGETRDKIQCCMLATCCHGVCSWSDYVGRNYLRDAILKNAQKKDETMSGQHFGQAEFDCMRRWCAASGETFKTLKDKELTSNDAVESNALEQDTEEHCDNNCFSITESNSVSVSAVVESLGLHCGIRGLGRACQRLIDYGRQQYMAKVLKFDNVKLVHYVPSEATPQNALLLAYRQPTS